MAATLETWKPESVVPALWKRSLRSPVTGFGLVAVLLAAAVALLAPVLASTDPFSMGAMPLRAPGPGAVMGTDNLGRDVYSQFVFGARVTLMVACLAVLMAAAIGVLVGALAGFSGGLIDEALMRFTEFFQVIPRFFLALLLVAIFGAKILNIVLVIGGLSWPVMARLVRAEFLALREFEFVEAARAVGASRLHIMFRELLPNALPAIIVTTSLEVGRAILLEAGLSFIGLGDPRTVTWGTMLHTAQPFLRQAWWLAIFPGLGICLVVWGINVVGDALNEALNPKT